MNIKTAYNNANTTESEADQSFRNYSERHDDSLEHALLWYKYPTGSVMDEDDLNY